MKRVNTRNFTVFLISNTNFCLGLSFQLKIKILNGL